MKNSTPKSKLLNIFSGSQRGTLENIQKKTPFSSKSVKNMPAQLIAPPAHVWSKIEAILDKQDERRKSANNIIAASFGLNAPGFNCKKVYVSAAGLSLVQD